MTSILGHGKESISVAVEEIDTGRRRDAVYVPDIINQPDRL